MACEGVQLHREIFSCPIWLGLLKDPVMVPCGHKYGQYEHLLGSRGRRKSLRLPSARNTFTPRPVLLKNTRPAAVVEELKETGLQDPADRWHAGFKDVACDVCTGRSMKAVKTCLVCLLSFCGKHFQGHQQMAPLPEHKLVEPRQSLQENVCTSHNQVTR